jgi:hypothetical protein
MKLTWASHEAWAMYPIWLLNLFLKSFSFYSINKRNGISSPIFGGFGLDNHEDLIIRCREQGFTYKQIRSLSGM